MSDCFPHLGKITGIMPKQGDKGIESIERKFKPGYFAFVMATGINSIACDMLMYTNISKVLFGINIAAYLVLAAIIIFLTIRHFDWAVKELMNSAGGLGFFTIVAGTCILGSQFSILTDKPIVGQVLLIAAAIMWFIFVYVFLAASITHLEKQAFSQSLSGEWLILAVSTQSISILGTLLSGNSGAYEEIYLFAALAMYMLGCALYLIIICLIFYRLVFLPFTANDFSPSYWINMGAAAISVLAGSELIDSSQHWPNLSGILVFLKGFTLFFWVMGTWWIPLLVILEIRKHISGRFLIRFDPRSWEMVFPLGMYTVCTFRFAQVVGPAGLQQISRYFIFISLLAWITAFAGFIFRLREKFVSLVRT